MMMLLMTTMGESILVETMKAATYFVTCSRNNYHPKQFTAQERLKEGRHCYFFMQGTGLDNLIATYALDYEPDTLRQSFNFYVRTSV